MAARKSLDIAARVRNELDELARAGCGDVTLANLGSVTVDNLLDNSTIRDAIAAKGHTTSEAQREYILADIIKNQDKIISDTVTERNAKNEEVLDKNGNPVVKKVYKYGDPISEDELRKAFSEETKITIPSGAMDDKVLNGSYRKRIENERARVRKIGQDAQQADEANGGPQKLDYKSEINDGSSTGGQTQDAQQEDAARKARAEALQAELEANKAAMKAMNDGLDDLMRLGKITAEEYTKGRAVVALHGFIQNTNSSIRSLSDVSNYMSSTRDGTIKTWWVGRQFKRERNRHAKIAARALRGFNDLTETLQDRVDNPDMKPGKSRGIFSGMRDKIGNRGRTSAASSSEPKTGALRKAGGMIKKAAGVTAVVGGVVAGRVFKSFHPLMWVKGTYQEIRDALKTSIDDNKRPENAKDPATVEAQYAGMVSPTPESKEMSKGCKDAVKANHAMTLEALMQTPEGRQYVANTIASTPEWSAAINNSVLAFLRANGVPGQRDQTAEQTGEKAGSQKGQDLGQTAEQTAEKAGGQKGQNPGQTAEQHGQTSKQTAETAGRQTEQAAETVGGQKGQDPEQTAAQHGQTSRQTAETAGSQKGQDPEQTAEQAGGQDGPSAEEVVRAVEDNARRRDEEVRQDVEKASSERNDHTAFDDAQQRDGQQESDDTQEDRIPEDDGFTSLDELEDLMDGVYTPEVTAAANESNDAADEKEDAETDKASKDVNVADDKAPAPGSGHVPENAQGDAAKEVLQGEAVQGEADQHTAKKPETVGDVLRKRKGKQALHQLKESVAETDRNAAEDDLDKSKDGHDGR